MKHPLVQFRNTTRERLAAGELCAGLFLLSASPIVAEACTTLPLDWVLLDAEASALPSREILAMLQSVTGTAVTPLVRVAKLDQQLIEQALDLGAHGILVPKVNSREDALAVVRAAYYPPLGRRGINPVRASGYFTAVKDYLRSANDTTLCMVQIETREALQSADEIAAVEGVSVLFVGPGDLASELGQPGDVTGPKMEAARRRVVAAAAAHGKHAGIFAYSAELAGLHVQEGFRFVAVGNDVNCLRMGLSQALGAIRV